MLSAACVFDWRERRIPNTIVVATLALGLCLQALEPKGLGLFDAKQFGGVGLVSAGGAALAALVAGMVLWRTGFFGAGDAKLLAAVASFMGLKGVVPLLVLTMVAGGLLALTSLVLQRRLGLTLFSLLTAKQTQLTTRLPYSLAVAAGALLQATLAVSGKQPW